MALMPGCFWSRILRHSFTIGMPKQKLLPELVPVVIRVLALSLIIEIMAWLWCLYGVIGVVVSFPFWSFVVKILSMVLWSMPCSTRFCRLSPGSKRRLSWM